MKVQESIYSERQFSCQRRCDGPAATKRKVNQRSSHRYVRRSIGRLVWSLTLRACSISHRALASTAVRNGSCCSTACPCTTPSGVRPCVPEGSKGAEQPIAGSTNVTACRTALFPPKTRRVGYFFRVPTLYVVAVFEGTSLLFCVTYFFCPVDCWRFVN